MSLAAGKRRRGTKPANVNVVVADDTAVSPNEPSAEAPTSTAAAAAAAATEACNDAAVALAAHEGDGHEAPSAVGARHETPALEQPQFKRSRTQSPLPSCAGVELAEEDKELDDELAFDGDHTRHMAHSVFMHIFGLLPTRQLPSLGLVSRHWRRMQFAR